MRRLSFIFAFLTLLCVSAFAQEEVGVEFGLVKPNKNNRYVDFKFMQDVRAHLEKKAGKLEFPEALLKRIMLNNNKDKDADFVEKNFEGSIKELAWHLIKEQIVAANNIKVEDDDVKRVAKEAVRAQFAQYGMSNVPDDVLENYATEQLKKRENIDSYVDRAVDMKLTQTLKNVVKLNEKSVSLDEFNKMMEEK